MFDGLDAVLLDSGICNLENELVGIRLIMPRFFSWRAKMQVLACLALPVVFAVPAAAAAEEAKRLPKNAYARPGSSILKTSDSFDFKIYYKGLQRCIVPSFAFKENADPKKWQNAAREKLESLLHMPSGKPSSLNAKLSNKAECSVRIGNVVHRYTRQEIIFYSHPGFPVCGYLLLPKGKTMEKFPAVICLPGHGSRVEDIVGLRMNGTSGQTLSTAYQHDLAVQCVANGYATLAIELLGSGARSSEASRKEFPAGRDCRTFGNTMALFGDTLLGYRIFDVMRAIDYMQSRQDVQKDKIATMGVSAGATLSLFSAAIDPRVKCAVVSCYFNDLRSSLMSHAHCSCHYIPSLATNLRIADIGGLIAPRTLILEASKADVGFPLKGALQEYIETQKIFKALNAPKNVLLFQTEGDHEFDGRDVFKVMNKELK